jgi:hypothetical protein
MSDNSKLMTIVQEEDPVESSVGVQSPRGANVMDADDCDPDSSLHLDLP